MHRSARLLAVVLAAGGLLAVAPAAHAVVDPAIIAECLTASIGEVPTLVDPAAPSLPAELPAVHCLAP
ncbi:hypothetical protein [Nonomuraea jiangxiensis]|uniref:Uncharacterized protein n=1 Tax=Nonomuraea jiangxiensis TaxID=633440 RepID=A0A1G8N5B8_9ACTN|nr:hypothetical protein [Nonomuraea jiangxiensis]SDI75305.1 hypothetical protein SAMN05421869_10720 [Nonomuraea jiangxiensis]